MVTIHVDNSYSRITGLSTAQEKALSKELSYLVGGSSSYYSGFSPKRRSLLDKRGNFPSGLRVRVVEFLNNSGIMFNTKDIRIKPR